MDVARFLVDAVVLEGRSIRDVAASHGVSKSWVAVLVRRFKEGGYEAVARRPKVAKTNPGAVQDELEDRIVVLRKELTEQGLDAGAHTIHYHLSLTNETPPSVSTIWRVLKRRGFITPQPQKRPRSSYIRFEATLPNECWQTDVTFYELADATKAEILNFIDDFSRLCVASRVFPTTTAPDVVATFYKALGRWGSPASVLSDNGCIFTATYRGGYAALESELLSLGIVFKHSRPYHPQTCGKVERLHQTLKRYLAKQKKPSSIEGLQEQVDRFVEIYNELRPHRAKGRMTPRAAFDSRTKARPIGPKVKHTREMRIRRDKVDKDGSVTLRYRSKLHHIGIGRALKGTRVILLVAGLDVRVLSEEGQLLRELTLDPSRDYQPQGRL